jgi:glycosyltransferase involved in cell wall biosynthesis
MPATSDTSERFAADSSRPSGIARMTLAVCIATRNRADLLDETLASLAHQLRPADEVWVCDASDDDRSRRVVERQAATLRAGYVPSRFASLPTQRRIGFEQCTSDVVMFLDDDVTLAPTALQSLMTAYEAGESRGERPAGVGLILVDMPNETERNRRSVRERWLGTSVYEHGVVTPGGLGVSHHGLPPGEDKRVDWFQGPTMSFRRRILDEVLPLHGLEQLYLAGVGRAEDLVLSQAVARHGPLVLVTDRLAIHRNDHSPNVYRAYANHGWRYGLTGTVGRSFVMQWAAAEPRAGWAAWRRLATLEMARAVRELIRGPWRSEAWGQAAGCLWGTVWAALHAGRYPASPAAAVKLRFLPGLRRSAELPSK